MSDVNNLNVNTSIIANKIDDVNHSSYENNQQSASASLSFSYFTSFSPSSSSSSTFVTASNNTNSMLLTDFVMNTTTVAMDYATQWLSTTIATAAANLTNISNETAIFSTSTPSSTFTISSTNDFLNYTTTASFDGTDKTTNSVTLSDLTNIYANANAASTISSIVDDNYYDECHPDNPNFNCSRMDYIVFMLGPQRLPLYKALLITILYGGIFFTGFFGNLFVCIVIFKHPALHTATNYYLFSLAVSDLIYLIFGLPTEVILYWHQYPYLFGLPFCKARAYISEASTYVSVLTIVAFSMERYLAICHPLYLYAMSGFKRALRIIVFLWLLSLTFAIPFYIYTNIKYWYYPPDETQITESAICTFDTPENFPLFEVSSLFSFFIPMFSMFYFYGRMGIKICSRTTQKLGVHQGSVHRESRHQQSRKAIIRMLAAVVVTFFICWLPFHIQRLWYVHGKTYKYYQEVNEWLFSMTGFAYYVTCTINPILYNVMSHRYRVAFKDTLCCKRRNSYYNNGFSRDQSSFRETTIASTLCTNSTYDRVHSVRVRSLRIVNNVKDRSSIKSNISWKKSNSNTRIEKDIPENLSKNLSGTNAIVVCIDSGVNSRTKVFTENEVQETLLNKNNETCI